MPHVISLIPMNNYLYEKLTTKPDYTVIILMALVTLPHFERIPWLSIVSIIVIVLWKLLILECIINKPYKLVTTLATLVAAFFIYKHSNSFSGISAGSHLLVVMAFFKLLESNNKRDYMLLVILSFFIISTNFLFSQTLSIAFYMFFCLFMTLITLLTINQKSCSLSLADKSRISLKLIAFTLPTMVILFAFFPRITGPLWSTKADQSQAKTGLSDSMEPGNISSLIYSNELVFRTAFKDKLPPINELYWRAITLWNFDGRKWTMNNASEPQANINISDPTYEYTVILEPNNKKWLFLLDLPYKINKNFNINSDFTAQSKKPVNSLLQYTANSSQNYYLTNNLHPDFKVNALTLPKLNTQTKQLALQWKNSSSTTDEIIQKALQYFSEQEFYYKLTPKKLNKVRSIDQFLFETREGFCEHYSSAFTVLMRAAGIPSRIVLGYLGGEINPFNNVISVDQSMAHAWSEVWIDKKGWVRIDPTAAIAPERVSKDVAAALKDQAGLPLHLQINIEALNKLKQFLSAIDNNWNQWILNYNEENQRKLLEYLTGEKYNLIKVSTLFIQIILITLFLTAIFYFLNEVKREKDPVNRAYKKLSKKLLAAGLEKHTDEGPSDYKKRLIKHLPNNENDIKLILNLYIEIKYKENKEPYLIKQFVKAIQQFKL